MFLSRRWMSGSHRTRAPELCGFTSDILERASQLPSKRFLSRERHPDMAAVAPTAVLPDAAPARALSALLRRSQFARQLSALDPLQTLLFVV